MMLPAVGEVTSLNVELFEAELSCHPDRAKVNFVLQCIKEGFRLGWDKLATLKSARRNKLSAYQHTGLIDVYLDNEVRLGRVVRKDCETVSFHVNNEAVVHILNSWTSKDPNIMHLLRSLLKVAAYLSFTFAAVLFQEKLTA